MKIILWIFFYAFAGFESTKSESNDWLKQCPKNVESKRKLFLSKTKH